LLLGQPSVLAPRADEVSAAMFGVSHARHGAMLPLA
jgi:hypothetical protein